MTQRTSKELILDSLFLKFESEIARARAELMIYLSNPAGIGEHSEIVEEIEKKVKKIADSASYHETLKQLSSPSENNEEVDTTSKNERIVVKVKMDENLTDAEKQFFADVQLMRGSSGASGYDLCTLEGGTLQAGETKVFRTGVFLEIPPGFEGQVRSRSGWALKGVVAANSPGTIDSDYRGEIKVLLTTKEISTKQLKHKVA